MALINCPECDKQISDKAEICVGCGAPVPFFRVIGTPLEFEGLLIAEFDFPKKMNWDDAKKACQDLGNGWKLPNKNELNILYKNKDKIGGFELNCYFSSTEAGYIDAWNQNFYNGSKNNGYKSDCYNVRAIRSFKRF